MSNRFYILISALVGVITGFITIHSFFVSSWTSIFLWIAVGLVVLYFSPDRRTAIRAGIAFGFFDIASWLASDFHGHASQIPGLLALLVILGAIAAAAGAIGAMIFFRLFRRQ